MTKVPPEFEFPRNQSPCSRVKGVHIRLEKDTQSVDSRRKQHQLRHFGFRKLMRETNANSLCVTGPSKTDYHQQCKRENKLTDVVLVEAGIMCLRKEVSTQNHQTAGWDRRKEMSTEERAHKSTICMFQQVMTPNRFFNGYLQSNKCSGWLHINEGILRMASCLSKKAQIGCKLLNESSGCLSFVRLISLKNCSRWLHVNSCLGRLTDNAQDGSPSWGCSVYLLFELGWLYIRCEKNAMDSQEEVMYH